MKLTLSHADLSLALCEFLAARGMTAFDPNTVSAEFSFKRGSKELVCELDSEPKAPVVVAAATAPVVATQAPAPAPEQAPETPAQEPEVTYAAQPDAPGETELKPSEAPAGDDDNLFD